MPYDQKILIKCSLSEEPWNGSNWGNWRNMTNQWWSKTVKHVTNGERNKTTYLTNTGIKHHNDCKKGQVAWETWMDSWGLGRSWARGQILLGRGKVGGIFGTEDVCDAYRAVGDWPLVRWKENSREGRASGCMKLRPPGGPYYSYSLWCIWVPWGTTETTNHAKRS